MEKFRKGDIDEIGKHKKHPYLMNTKWFVEDKATPFITFKNILTLSFIAFNIFAYTNKFKLITGKKLLFLDIVNLLGIFGYSGFEVLNFDLEKEFMLNNIYNILLEKVISIKSNIQQDTAANRNPYGNLSIIGENKEIIFKNNFKCMSLREKLLFKIKYLLLINKIKRAIFESLNDRGNIEISQLLSIFRNNKKEIMEIFLENKSQDYNDYDFQYGVNVHQDKRGNNIYIVIDSKQYKVELESGESIVKEGGMSEYPQLSYKGYD